jgi:hypothetical protein
MHDCSAEHAFLGHYRVKVKGVVVAADVGESLHVLHYSSRREKIDCSEFVVAAGGFRKKRAH